MDGAWDEWDGSEHRRWLGLAVEWEASRDSRKTDGRDSGPMLRERGGGEGRGNALLESPCPYMLQCLPLCQHGWLVETAVWTDAMADAVVRASFRYS